MTYNKFFEEDPFGKQAEASKNLKKFMKDRNLVSPESETDISFIEGLQGRQGLLWDIAVGTATGAAGGLAERYTKDK